MGDRGFADVAAVLNCAVRLSCALRPDDDSGVVTGAGSGVTAPGALYSKPRAGKVRIRCSNWRGDDCCEVKEKKKKSAVLTFTF